MEVYVCKGTSYTQGEGYTPTYVRTRMYDYWVRLTYVQYICPVEKT